MFPYLLGILIGLKEHEHDTDLSNVDIDKLEEILGEAKRIQYPKKYIMTQEEIDVIRAPKSPKYNKEAADVLEKLLKVSNITKDEIIVLMKELKTYEEEN